MAAPPLHVVVLDDFVGLSVRSSPFLPGRFAICAAANFGIVGNGRLVVQQEAAPIAAFTTTAALYDAAWSELLESQVVAACADGSLKLYDIAAHTQGRPLMAFVEHEAEVSAVDWNLVAKDTFVSASWDGTLKVWHPERPSSLLTLAGHASRAKVWEARCAPHHASTVLSASADGTARVWDVSAGPHANGAALVLPCGGGEVLSVDWSKYDANLFASASVDGVVRLHDLRQPGVPLAAREGHTLAARRVRFSPHSPTLLLSASYDTSVCLWDVGGHSGSSLGQLTTGDVPPLQRFSHHREFAVGLEWSLFEEGVAASCGWDCQFIVWRV